MTAEFIGVPDIEHVAQPAGTELCFPAIMASMSGASIAEAHEVLMANRLSGKDGSTGIIVGQKKLEIAGSLIVIDPLEEAADPEAYMEGMDEQFEAGRGVTLFHKKNDDPDDDRHHWTLFPGYYHKGAIRTIDPLRPQAEFRPRREVVDLINRSMNFAGVYGYALTAGEDEPQAK